MKEPRRGATVAVSEEVACVVPGLIPSSESGSSPREYSRLRTIAQPSELNRRLPASCLDSLQTGPRVLPANYPSPFQGREYERCGSCCLRTFGHATVLRHIFARRSRAAVRWPKLAVKAGRSTSRGCGRIRLLAGVCPLQVALPLTG